MNYPGGLFISLEGPDGSGKTLQIEALKEELEKRGYEVLLSREPGGTPIGEAVRDLLLDPSRKEMHPRTEALLYAASRAQHVFQKIRPALEKGMVVILDRFVDSSLIYQGLGRELGIQEIASLNAFATGDLMPRLTFVLSLPYEEGLKRKKSQEGHELDRLELEKESFHRRISEGYNTLASLYPERIVLLDARKTPEEIHRLILDRIRTLLD